MFMHAPRTMRTPRSMRTRTAPDAARSRPMLVRFDGGVWTPSTIRRRATPHTGFPMVIMFMVARWTIGATRAKRPRAAIHTRAHRSALPSFLVYLSHAGGTRAGRRASGRTPAGVVISFLASAHIQTLFALPEVVCLKTRMIKIVPYTLCYLIIDCMCSKSQFQILSGKIGGWW